MKIRIKGNSLRLRLSKTDLKLLAENKPVKDEINFGVSSLHYMLHPNKTADVLSAAFAANTITVHIPQSFSVAWNSNEVVSIDARQPLHEGELHILVEKDFQCLDKTSEDQSDYFVNPDTTCK